LRASYLRRPATWVAAAVFGAGVLAAAVPRAAFAQGGPLLALTLTNPDQTAALSSDTLVYSGTITNNTGADLTAGDLFVNFVAGPAALTLSQVLGVSNPDLAIPNGTTTAVLPLFSASFTAVAAPGTTYPFRVFIEDVNGNASAPPGQEAPASATLAGGTAVVPEPGTVGLTLLGAAGVIARRRRGGVRRAGGRRSG
jgi:hypothetical protein